jgi:hypothetical protein
MGNRLFPIKDKLRASTVSSAARLSIPFKSLVFGMDPRLCAPWLPRVYLFGNFFSCGTFKEQCMLIFISALLLISILL